MTITNKEFPAFLSLLERAKEAIPEVYGDVEKVHTYWRTNGCIDIQVTFIQDAPTERLREFHPGHYTIHFVWNPYQGGGWYVTDYGDGEWKLPFDKKDTLLKLYKPHV